MVAAGAAAHGNGSGAGATCGLYLCGRGGRGGKERRGRGGVGGGGVDSRRRRSGIVADDGAIVWRFADGSAIGCAEKRKVLDDNLAEIRQLCQDALEDALLMGCDEAQVRQAFAAVIRELRNPLRSR